MKKKWEIKTLDEVCEYISRGISPKYTELEGLIVINQKCIRDHSINLDLVRLHDSSLKEVSFDKMIREGDVLINSTGQGTLGRLAQVKEDTYATVDSHITIVRPKKEIFNAGFFAWALFNIEDEIANSGAGTSGQTELAREIVRNLVISYPKDKKEQKRIVKILDEKFAQIEELKKITEQQIKNSKELFESYLQNIFANPGEGWEEKELVDLATFQYGYTGKSKSEGRYRYVRISDTNSSGLVKLKNKVYLDSFDLASNYLLKKEDLLTARIGASAGKVLFFNDSEESIFASYLIRSNFDKKIVNKFYWYFSKTNFYWDQVRELSAGAAQPQFNGNALKQVIFSYPVSLNEQKAIVKKLDELSEKTKALEAIYKQKLVDLEELKKSLLQKAFAGEL